MVGVLGSNRAVFVRLIGFEFCFKYSIKGRTFASGSAISRLIISRVSSKITELNSSKSGYFFHDKTIVFIPEGIQEEASTGFEPLIKNISL